MVEVTVVALLPYENLKLAGVTSSQQTDDQCFIFYVNKQWYDYTHGESDTILNLSMPLKHSYTKVPYQIMGKADVLPVTASSSLEVQK